MLTDLSHLKMYTVPLSLSHELIVSFKSNEKIVNEQCLLVPPHGYQNLINTPPPPHTHTHTNPIDKPV